MRCNWVLPRVTCAEAPITLSDRLESRYVDISFLLWTGCEFPSYFQVFLYLDTSILDINFLALDGPSGQFLMQHVAGMALTCLSKFKIYVQYVGSEGYLLYVLPS